MSEIRLDMDNKQFAKAAKAVRSLSPAQRKALKIYGDGATSPSFAGVNVMTARVLVDKGLLAMQGSVFSKRCVLFITEAGHQCLAQL